jgi:hypothetical protein
VTLIINLTRKSLQIELYNFADFLEVPSCTKQAFSKARKKLSAMVFHLLNAKFLEEFYSNNIIKTINGLRVIAIDGSTIKLPVSKELYEQYGSATNGTANSVPLARTSLMFDVLNNITLHATLNSYATSERGPAFEHINELIRQNNRIQEKSFIGDLLLFDRGYPSLPLMFFLSFKKINFLMRIQRNFLLETNDVIEKGLKDVIIKIPAFKDGRIINSDFKKYMPNLDKNAVIEIRVLVFELSSGQQEIIVTSLLDQELYSYDEIFKLYSLRWNIEECYKFYKSIAEIENFSGKSKLAVEQDFYSTIFTCNICAMLMQEAQDELDEASKKENQSTINGHSKKLKYEYKINRNILVGLVKNEIIDVFLSNQDLDEYCAILKNRIKQNMVPIRPNRMFTRFFKSLKRTIYRRAL